MGIRQEKFAAAYQSEALNKKTFFRNRYWLAIRQEKMKQKRIGSLVFELRMLK